MLYFLVRLIILIQSLIPQPPPYPHNIIVVDNQTFTCKTYRMAKDSTSMLLAHCQNYSTVIIYNPQNVIIKRPKTIPPETTR